MKRVSGLVTANLHELIDGCEDPETMLKHSVREMENALGRLMDGAARAIAHHKLLVRQLEEQKLAAERRLKRAQAAVPLGDDAAARRELKFRAEHQQLAASLSQQVESAEALGEKLRSQVTALRIRLNEARRRLIEVTTRSRAAQAQRKFVDYLPKDADAACSTFDVMCARVEQAEAETDALLELLGENEVSESLDREIEAELHALKETASHVAS